VTDGAVWVPVDDKLQELTGPDLWGLLEDLDEYNRRSGGKRSEAGLHVKSYCREESARVRSALRAQGLPTSPPDRPWSAWRAQHTKGQADDESTATG
jgi:hypothetical protein